MVLGFSIALILRVLSGEPVLKYNAIIKYYGYVEPHTNDYVSHFDCEDAQDANLSWFLQQIREFCLFEKYHGYL